MRSSRCLVILSALALSILGCDSERPPLEPTLGGGKTDVAERVELRGPLALEGEVRGELVENLEYHGYAMDVPPGAVVTLDVTRTGSTRSLDTVLFVHGPGAPLGSAGSDALAWDDDSGWGRLSRLRDLALDEGGPTSWYSAAATVAAAIA